MPILKSAKKRVRQNKTAHARNHARASRMRSLYKNLIKWFSGGEIEKANSFFDDAQKEIDLCAKNNLIHKNNAARKKSRLAKLKNAAEKSAPKKAEKPAPKAKKPTSKKSEKSEKPSTEKTS